jgi:hypothetical protein
MTDTGSCVRRAAMAVCLIFLAVRPSAAQLAPPPLTDPPTSPQLMSRYDFHLSADSLANRDPRFVWDTHFGGDFDLVDYVHGRVTVLVDYQAVLGNEIRPFDPNQGNYTLEAAGSGRTRGIEGFVVLHHVSRHFGDRAKAIPIAWNVLQARVLKHVDVGGSTIDVRIDAGKIVARATVDYSWTADADVLVRRRLNDHVGIFARGYLETFGVYRTVAGRNRQTGGRVEGGFRLPGRGGAIELFGGYERIVDADPLEQLPLRWGFLGFRMVTK